MGNGRGPEARMRTELQFSLSRERSPGAQGGLEVGAQDEATAPLLPVTSLPLLSPSRLLSPFHMQKADLSTLDVPPWIPVCPSIA